MSKWTAGEWRVESHPERNMILIGTDDYIVCEINEVVEQDCINAFLLQAAPELYESHEPDRLGPVFLDWIADRLILHGDHPNADFIICLRRRAEKSRNALAKARGNYCGY